MRDFVDNARLAVRYMPTRVFVTIVGLFVLLVLASKCATAWPPACPLTDGVRKCQCDVSWREILRPHAFGKPRPACTVGYECDRKPLPITVNAEDCGP